MDIQACISGMGLRFELKSVASEGDIGSYGNMPGFLGLGLRGIKIDAAKRLVPSKGYRGSALLHRL